MSTTSGSRDDGRFDALAEEFAERHRRGERPSLQEYVDRLPEMAEEIREMFPALVEVERADGDARGEARRPPAPAIARLREIGDYRILREVGRGGMGVVYEAEQVSLGRRVALKVLLTHGLGDRTAMERFRREAKAAARMHHTNIVPVFEVGREGGYAFYAMQLIQGEGLDQVIEELARRHAPDRRPDGPGPCPASPGSLADAADAHADRPPLQGRDLGRIAEWLLNGRMAPEAPGPPATTGLDRTEAFGPDAPRGLGADDAGGGRAEGRAAAEATNSAVLPGGKHVSEVDASGRRQPFFRSVAQIGRQAAQGLAHAHSRGIVHRDIKPSNLLLDTDGVVWITDFGLAKDDDDGLTQTGDIIGTLRYMAPCRFRGEGDARADIYALGMTLYELLTLRPAYDSPDRLELIEQIKAQEPPRPRSIDGRIPRDLETIVLKAIAKDPERRYQSAGALAEDLRRFLADEPILARRPSAAERYWRWARRHPAIAILGAVLTAVLVLATLGSLLVAQRFRAQASANQALANDREAQRRAAESERLKAVQSNASLRATQESLRRTVYATRSNLALAAWDDAHVGRLRALLDLLRPQPGESDLRGWEWRFLWQLGHEERLALSAENTAYHQIAFSPDGRTIAGLAVNSCIELWDRRTGERRRTIGAPMHGPPASLGVGVASLAFSPDGRQVAGPGPDGSLALHAVDTGQVSLRFEGRPGAVRQLAWSPDGQTLVAALSTHVMRAWDAHDGRLIHEVFGGHGGPVAAVAFSPDGRTVASGSYDHTVKLWDLADPVNPRVVFKGHTDEVRAVAFSPDGRRLVSAGLDRSIRVWDAGSGTQLAVLWGHGSAVLSLAFLPDGARVATGSSDETIRVWDTATGQELRTFKGHVDEVSTLAVSPDGRDLASASSGGADAMVRVWDTASLPHPRTLESPSVLTYGGCVESLAFSPDGRRLVSGHDDHALRVWDLSSVRPPLVIKGHGNRILCVAFSPDGLTIASGGADGTVRLWDAITGGPRITFTGHTDVVAAVIFTPDGRTVLSCGSDRTIQAWDPATGAVRYVLRGHTGLVHDLALSPDGRTLASAGYDKTAILWDLPAQQPRATIRGHTDRVNSVAFSPDGRALATSSRDRTVRLWGTATGSARGILSGHIADVDGLAFDTEGRLASSAWDKTIRIWDPKSRQAVLILKAHAARIRRIRLSPDGRTLASASSDRTVKLWEAAPAAILAPSGGGPTAESQGDRPARPPGEGPGRPR